MENNILNTIENLTLEILIISLIVFGLTMLIKYPIKKATSNIAEDKRKAINSVIILIPIVLSFVISILYFGITKKEWFAISTIETAVSSCLLAFSIYAICQRIVILIKGIKSGKIEANSELTKDTISFLKDNLKVLTSKLKIDEKNLSKITEQITSLVEIKAILESSSTGLNISKLAETNVQIQSLTNEKAKLKQEITTTQEQIQNYENKLYNKKGE